MKTNKLQRTRNRTIKTTRKPVTVVGIKATRTGIMTVRHTDRKRNPVTVQIAFTSSLETRKAEPFFWIDGPTESECVLGLSEQFSLTIS